MLHPLNSGSDPLQFDHILVCCLLIVCCAFNSLGDLQHWFRKDADFLHFVNVCMFDLLLFLALILSLLQLVLLGDLKNHGAKRPIPAPSSLMTQVPLSLLAPTHLLRMECLPMACQVTMPWLNTPAFELPEDSAYSFLLQFFFHL
jgi:hypothetical protein